jgi:hypothetical protein
MGLNHINMPASLIAGLYKTCLVEGDTAPAVTIAPDNKIHKKGIQYLGKNQKGVCVLVDYTKDVYLPDEQLHFLTTILQACRLNLGDVAIVNFRQHPVSFEKLREQVPCNYLLIFGVEPAKLGLEEMPLFTTCSVHDCNIVHSPAAEQLNNNNPDSKLLKSKLWLCLKQLFTI